MSIPPGGLQILRQLLERANASGSRSTVLKPLQGVLITMVVGALAAAYVKAPEWMIMSILAAIGVDLLAIFVAYFYFMVKDPDALRSEKFSIEKLAIERGYLGDSLTGILRQEQHTGTFDDVRKLPGDSGHG